MSHYILSVISEMNHICRNITLLKISQQCFKGTFFNIFIFYLYTLAQFPKSIIYNLRSKRELNTMLNQTQSFWKTQA